MNKIRLNELLELTNAREVRCTIALTQRLTAQVTADITQAAQLDDLSALYGEWEVTSVDSGNGRLLVAIRKGAGAP